MPESTFENQNEEDESVKKIKSKIVMANKVVFDYDQLDYIKFRLSFSDGFLFGLGLIIAQAIFVLILISIFSLAGYSLVNSLF